MSVQQGDLICREAVELATNYLEGALSPSDQRRFEEHFARCPACAEFLEQIRTTIALYGQLVPDEFDPRLRDAFTGMYETWRTKYGPAAGTSATEGRPVPN